MSWRDAPSVIWAWRTRSAAFACSRLCPGFSRTMICSHHELFAANRLSGPRMSGSAAKGNITSVIRPTSGPKNPGGITPTM